MNVWKMEFAKDIWVSLQKLDDIMEDLWLKYQTSIKDKRMLLVSEDDQKIIKDAIWIK